MKINLKKYHSLYLRSIVTLVMIFFFNGLSAQRVLLSRNVLADTVKSHYGQNQRHFAHPYLGLGFMAGPSEAGGNILYGVSPNLEIGGRYKLKITRHTAIGCNLAYNLYSYKLRQSRGKILPDTLLHKAERLLFHNITLGVYERVSLGRTGNHIGKFIDLGVYGDYILYANQYTRDKFPDGTTVRAKTSGLGYINKFQYGLFGHFGISSYVFTVKVRMSDLFSGSQEFPELPRWTFGVQMGLHRIN